VMATISKSSGTLLRVTRDGAVKVQGLDPPGEPLTIMRDAAPRAITISDDGSVLAFSNTTSIYVLMRSGSPVSSYNLQLSEAGVSSMAFSSDRHQLVAADPSGVIHIANLNNGQVRKLTQEIRPQTGVKRVRSGKDIALAIREDGS